MKTSKHNIAGRVTSCRIIPFLKYPKFNVTNMVPGYVPLVLAIGGRSMNSLSLEYLTSCSTPTLEEAELIRLNEAANIRKQLIRMMDELRMKEAEAIMVRMVLNDRAAKNRPALQTNFPFALLPPAPAVPKKKKEKLA